MPNNLPKGNPLDKKVLEKLYIDQKQSLSETAKTLKVSVHKITYWMERYQISRRSQSESVYLKHNPNGDPYKIKAIYSLDEEKLKNLALGIYWGEGNKTNHRAVRVTNSDPGVIRQFKKFLIEICHAKIDKIGYYLQTFKDNDIDKAKHYWADSLGISPEKIHTCRPVHSLGSGTYKKINDYGVMTIGFFNIHLKTWIMSQLGDLGMVR